MDSHFIPSDQLTKHRRPLDSLTGVRFFAALYVVVYHSKLSDVLADHHLRIASNFLKSGYLSVSLFFLLSGFILAYTYCGRIAHTSERRKFWEARIARLYPMYLLALVLTCVVNLALPKWSDALAALMMVQTWNPFDQQMWGTCNYVCWTLSVEAFFYLVMPFYQSLLEKAGTHGQVALSIAMFMCAAVLNSSIHVLGYTEGWLAVVPLPILRLPEFLVGVGVGNLFLRYESRDPLNSKVFDGRGKMTYISAGAAFVMLCLARGAFTSFILIPFTGIILGLALESTALSRLMRQKWILFGGAISYGMYLLQVAAKDSVSALAAHFHLALLPLRFIAMILILTAASTLAYEYVELPGREKLRSFFTRMG